MKLACITLDTEPDLGSGRCDIELFRDAEKLRAFREVLDRHEVKVTGFLVTKLLRENPSLVEHAQESLPIRFESHSHHHDQRETDSERELDETVRWYERFFGRRPRGYRAPNGILSEDGLERLAERGFVYDSSIFPSYRFDEYAYNHLRLPTLPFVYRTAHGELIELPLAVISGIRLVVSVSYIKLLGWRCYELLIGRFGLPDVLIVDSHPYDFFVRNHLPRIRGWKRWAHGRNADSAMSLFEKLLETLRSLGYRFVYIDELLERLQPEDMVRVDTRRKR